MWMSDCGHGAQLAVILHISTERFSGHFDVL
jgi:hypothetical protein